MRIAERLLLLFSRPTNTSDCIPVATDKNDETNALKDLFTAFPALKAEMQGKTILDYGCGPGWQTISLAREGAGQVVGVDINPHWLKHAQSLIERFSLENKSKIYTGWNVELEGTFDIVISKDSFEHYHDPVLALNEMKKALRPGGKLYIVFSWPWFSPLGSHMQVFTLVPWVNILFSERTVMKVRSYYRDDGARRYEDVESGLNKMSVARSERIIRSSNFLIEHRFLRGFKNWHVLTKIPILRELFTQQVGFILSCPR